ncbi:hypothetical protein QL093DRAFT_2565542 [Fusarium oxysporum]|nr:hypothetical protein QL093DRAFT_2565542 [Fusarium oxysporum]
MLCLDIPVPRCVRKLIFEPTVCLPNVQDIKAVNLIRNFGKEFGRWRDEIEQVCNLASGQSDLVILLERPHKSQTYRRTFGDFVKRCETLKRVDELIRFSSKGARSIHTVTVLDAFSFKPEDSTRIPSERCHQLIEEILKLKKPKVVLCCWNQPCEQPFLARFKSDGVGTWLFRYQVDIEGFSTIAIRSFHPAAAVCYNELRKACCRMLLICHFILQYVLSGFGCLLEVRAQIRGSGDRSTVRAGINALLKQLFTSGYNKGAQDITKLCLLWRDYKYYHLATRQDILNRLVELGSRQGSYQGQGAVSTFSPACKSYYVGFADDKDDDDLEKQLASLNIHENALSVEDELKDLLQRIENVATEVISHIQLSVELQITIFSPDRIDLSKIIAELTQDMCRYVDEVTAHIVATLSILAGEEGLRPNARSIIDSVLLEGRILFSLSQDVNNDAVQTLFDAPRNLEDMSANIKSTLNTLLILQDHVKLLYKDKGLGALYRQIRKQALLQWPSIDL